MRVLFTVFCAAVIATISLSGCATPLPPPFDDIHSEPESSMILAPGVELEIVFFGADDLNTTQQIRRDGKITLKLVGDVEAAGKTPAELEQALLDLYEKQLQVKSITVLVRHPGTVLVSGAVLAPGRVPLTHQLSALEAIMSAGGFDFGRADVQRVMVIRHIGNKRESYMINLEAPLAGEPSRPFYVRSLDTVIVPWTKKAKKYQLWQTQE